MINNKFMSDDNKTNEELLKEVKKLREIVEEKETPEQREKRHIKFIIRFAIIGTLVLISSIICFGVVGSSV